ncbi:MAG: phage holin family protein [Nitriliruptorales bacterium]|nr:phage holin family protein [Nitriliruptorales bacterium]
MSTSLPPQDSTTPLSPDSRRFFARSHSVGTGAAAKAVAEDASRLVRAEIELAKAEVTSAVQAKAMGGGLLVVAALAGWLALQGLLIAIGLLLALVLPGWAAALIVTGVLLFAVAIAGVLGQRRLKTPVNLETTKQSVEEDVAWAKAHLPNR